MRQRARKLVGTFATIFFLIAYSLIAMAIGGHFVVGGGLFAELAYFVVAGLAWLPVVMVLIRWMARAALELLGCTPNPFTERATIRSRSAASRILASRQRAMKSATDNADDLIKDLTLQANRDRLRPILMTTVASVMGLLPMTGWLAWVPLVGKLGSGAGAELRAPMAITVIAGLSSATALTLLVIPSIYALIGKRAGRRTA